jgi:hypothetical protein
MKTVLVLAAWLVQGFGRESGVELDAEMWGKLRPAAVTRNQDLCQTQPQALPALLVLSPNQGILRTERCLAYVGTLFCISIAYGEEFRVQSSTDFQLQSSRMPTLKSICRWRELMLIMPLSHSPIRHVPRRGAVKVQAPTSSTRNSGTR